MTKKRSLGNFLPYILTLCIILGGFTSANAVTVSKTETYDAIDPTDGVDLSNTSESDHTTRVKSAEKDLYTFVYANHNGTNTMHIYSHPVKYVAKDNSIRDISLEIVAAKSGNFVTADHEIITTFSNKLTDGVSLEYDDVEIVMIPKLGLGRTPTAVLSNNNKTVTYETNDATSFVYELTYTGFKEDIVVEKYTGQTEYEFTLRTNGLTLCEEYGSYYLADAEGNTKATIGDIIIFTADERNNTLGTMTYKTVFPDQEYLLTIHLDAEYLASANTVYPIRIDPTIEINYANSGVGAIEDVTINQYTTFSSTSGSIYVGRHPAGSLSRTLMRFPNLSLDGIASENIVTASVELRDLICQTDEDITVECHIYNDSAPAWSENGTTSWSGTGTAYLGDLLDSCLVSYGEGNVSDQRYSFNILAAAKAWADGAQNPVKGLVFKADNAFERSNKTWYKTFASYNRSSYKPSLSITYTSVSLPKVVEISCFNREGFLDVPNGATATYIECNEPAERIRSVWFVEYQNNDYFTIRNYATGYYIVNSNSSLEHLPIVDAVADNAQWKFIEQTDGTFKIASKVNTNYYMTENNASHSESDPDIVLSSADCGERQKFHISSKTYCVSINNYYDYSFQMRMDNSLTQNTETINIINERQLRVNEYLYAEYGILVTYNTPVRRTSYADMCHGIDNISSETIELDCTHGPCDGLKDLCSHIVEGSGTCSPECNSPYHHNNSNKILSWFENELSSPSADINILWTGQRNCVEWHQPITNYTHIVATLYNTDDTKYWDYTAFHEIGHCLGAKGDDDCTNTWCLMSYKIGWSKCWVLLASPDENLFCDTCESQIRANIHQKYY